MGVKGVEAGASDCERWNFLQASEKNVILLSEGDAASGLRLIDGDGFETICHEGRIFHVDWVYLR